MAFSYLLIVVIAAIGLSILADRRNVPAPLLLAVVGIAVSFIPGLPRIELEPEIILTVVLPPLLFSAASEFSFMSFVRRVPTILNLGVILVAVTTLFVGWIAAAIVPALTLPAALVLGAVVSPPDAVTAVAIGRRLGLPKRVMTVLKGESLINDAAALTFFTFTVGALTGVSTLIENPLLFFLYGAVVGVLVGVVLGGIVHAIRVRLTNPALTTVLTILVPFTVYLLAEELSASGVLAVVAAGFSLGHNAAESPPAARMQEREFWATLDVLLEAFVFAYIGLQFRFVIEDAQAAGFDLPALTLASLLIMLAVIGIRFAWVFASALLARLRPRDGRRMRIRLRLHRRVQARAGRPTRGDHTPPEPFPWRENVVISWTGMRGVVTLAAAAGVPAVIGSGDDFAAREAIQAIAFAVTIGTLFIQGLSLPWLISKLDIIDPTEEQVLADEHRRADTIVRNAAIAAIEAFRDKHPSPETETLAKAMLAREARQQQGLDVAGASRPGLIALGGEVMAAQRAALIAARDRFELDDDVMREALERLDLQQALLENWTPEENERL